MELGRFEVIEELGKGGFGIVYKARDKVLNRQVALKVLHPELLINPEFISRFKHEAQLSAQLDHPNLLPIYDFGEFEGRFYIVMAYMPAGSLKDLLKKEGALDKQRSLKIFEDICEGMVYAHSEKIIHRDLKPGNILFDNRGKAYISDMGFAKLINSDSSTSMSTTGGMVGTPAYMAPEIWRSKQATSATDVYSLACVLVEMMTGEALFSAETTPEIMLKHFEPLQLPEGLPEEWKPVLEAALEKKPEDRIQTVGEFFEQIKAVELFLEEAMAVDLKETIRDKKYQETQQIQQTTMTVEKPKTGDSTREEEPQINRLSQSSEEGRSKSTDSLSEGERDPVRAGVHERKTKSGLIYVGFVLLAIVIGVIIYQVWNMNAKPALIFPPATATAEATQTAEVSKTATKTPTKTPTKAPTKTATATAEPVLGIGSTQIRDKDKMEQVYVPGGEFIMGSEDEDADAYENEKPLRIVYLNSYWIDKYEVTEIQYKHCVESGNCTSPIRTNDKDSDYDNHPVTNVSWDQAKSYCEWANEDNGSLPTEAQWEKAARGPKGNKYPWGDETLHCGMANFFVNDYCVGGTSVVGSYPDTGSPYGALDMAGNVWEWVRDWYAEKYDENDTENPFGPDKGRTRVIRGGSWRNYYRDIRSAYRISKNAYYSNNTLGFRCVSKP